MTIGIKRSGASTPAQDVTPEAQSKIDALLKGLKAKEEATNAETETQAAEAEAKANDLRNSISAGKSYAEIEHFLRALTAAFGSDLDTDNLSEEKLKTLAEKFSVTTDLDTHVAGTPVQFVGQGDSPATYNVTKDEIAVDGGDFGPEQAREMVALAALDKSMLKDGIDLSGNAYERSLIQMAVREHNKSSPKTKLNINAGGPRKKLGRGYDKAAKAAWENGSQKPSSGPETTAPEETPKDLGSLSEDTYKELTEHVKQEGKATDKILSAFLKAKIGETPVKQAVADAKAALKRESFIKVVPHGSKGERLIVNPSRDFGASASGTTADADGAKPKPKREKQAPKRPGPGEN